MKENIIGVIAVIALLASGLAYLHGSPLVSNGSKAVGATATGAGNLLAENYIPYILYNGGYNSAKDLGTTGNFNAAIGSFSGVLNASSTFFVTGNATIYGGTTTIATSNTATSTLVVGCIQTYATSTATPVRLQATTTSAGGTVLYSVFGQCAL